MFLKGLLLTVRGTGFFPQIFVEILTEYILILFAPLKIRENMTSNVATSSL